jgi:predicted transcriptional regulator
MSPSADRHADSTIGEQEFALLRHIADADSASVGEVVESFGSQRGLARSTVLTMMERLRKKRYLVRSLSGGVYRYRARATSARLLQGAVGRFVERHLGGSVSPFLAYLSEGTRLSDEELRQLEDVVAKLQSARKKGR